MDIEGKILEPNSLCYKYLLKSFGKGNVVECKKEDHGRLLQERVIAEKDISLDNTVMF